MCSFEFVNVSFIWIYWCQDMTFLLNLKLCFYMYVISYSALPGAQFEEIGKPSSVSWPCLWNKNASFLTTFQFWEQNFPLIYNLMPRHHSIVTIKLSFTTQWVILPLHRFAHGNLKYKYRYTSFSYSSMMNSLLNMSTLSFTYWQEILARKSVSSFMGQIEKVRSCNCSCSFMKYSRVL